MNESVLDTKQATGISSRNVKLLNLSCNSKLYTVELQIILSTSEEIKRKPKQNNILWKSEDSNRR